jgi:uncharacterized protein YcbK (DUF882 family)
MLRALVCNYRARIIVPFSFARISKVSSRPVRAGYCVSLAALLVVFGCKTLQHATAEGDTRSLSFHHTHTNETATITWKVNGRYDQEALKQINRLLRDWREDQTITMDPHLLDLIWEVYREVEATQPIEIVCGFRSPATNEMLRRRSSGVARYSQHTLGKAMDFFIPGVPLDKLREAGLRAQRGGVGFYPSSNFVHIDTGSVRHWPRMPDAQLARVIAKGPLTRFAKGGDTNAKVASAAKFSNPLAKLFGQGQDTDEDQVGASSPAPASAAKPEPKSVAAAVPVPPAKPAAAKPITTAKVEVKPDPKSETKPAAGGFDLASASSRPVQLRPAQSASLVGGQPAIAANDVVSANDVISARGFWEGLPETPAPQASVAAKSTGKTTTDKAATTVASADPAATGSAAPWPIPSREPAGQALAYAPAGAAPPPVRPAAMGPATARPAPQSADTTVALKRDGSKPTLISSGMNTGPVKVGQRFNNPWMRAMIVAPSAGGFMSTSLMGVPDYRVLSPYLQKPTTSVMMTFSDDPYLGMTTAKFSGTAVVFVSTVTFYQRTAALQ